MEKVIAFLNKHAIAFNAFFILFWLFILYEAFQNFSTENFSAGQIARLMLPIVFLTLSFFNLAKAIKGKKRQDQ
jgi:uncharacterized membrane protein